MLEIRKTIGLALTVLLGLVSDVAWAEGESGRCIPQPSTSVSLGRAPAVIHGLEPLVSIPSEGNLKLHSTLSDCCSQSLSPVGDITVSAGPYDPVSQRLYVWGYSKNGWIEIVNGSGTWYFGEGEIIEPLLYDPIDDIEDVTAIKRSEALGVQFYSGYTAPHWLTGNQSYRVYQITGTEMLRVTALEAQELNYVGDDADTGLAVFAPQKAFWGRNPQSLVLYDGVRTVTPPAGVLPITGWCY